MKEEAIASKYVLTSLSLHAGRRTRSSLSFVSVRKRPLRVDSASINPPLRRMSLYDIPANLDLTRKSSFKSRLEDVTGVAVVDWHGLVSDIFDAVSWTEPSSSESFRSSRFLPFFEAVSLSTISDTSDHREVAVVDLDSRSALLLLLSAERLTVESLCGTG